MSCGLSLFDIVGITESSITDRLTRNASSTNIIEIEYPTPADWFAARTSHLSPVGNSIWGAVFPHLVAFLPYFSTAHCPAGRITSKAVGVVLAMWRIVCVSPNRCAWCNRHKHIARVRVLLPCCLPTVNSTDGHTRFPNSSCSSIRLSAYRCQGNKDIPKCSPSHSSASTP